MAKGGALAKYGDYPCPECPRTFKLEGYRDRHIRKTHQANIVCPECLKPFPRPRLAAHMRNMHGIYGGISGRPRQPANLPAVIPPELPAINAPAHNGRAFHADPNLIVLVDDSGEIWVCERLGGRAR